MNDCTSKPLLITTGEPAGIGMDIVLDLMLNNQLDDLLKPIVITACLQSLRHRYLALSTIRPFQCTPNFIALDDKLECDMIGNHHDKSQHNRTADVYVIDTPVTQTVIAGQTNPMNAHMVIRQLNIAHNLVNGRRVCAIITAPIAKSVIIDSGITINGAQFTGHTEYFMAQSKQEKVVMMLANEVMRVALVTTHLPLRQVADAITKDELNKTIAIVAHEMAVKFNKANARILVCGLNPHAGENGHLGDEEVNIINPVLQAWQANGLNISLAMPADTIFTPSYLKQADVIIAMYHDQGLAPLKSHGFGKTVNITLGLPYIRTSVDHGTALDLAGSACASSASLLSALQMAHQMAKSKHQTLSIKLQANA